MRSTPLLVTFVALVFGCGKAEKSTEDATGSRAIEADRVPTLPSVNESVGAERSRATKDTSNLAEVAPPPRLSAGKAASLFGNSPLQVTVQPDGKGVVATLDGQQLLLPHNGTRIDTSKLTEAIKESLRTSGKRDVELRFDEEIRYEMVIRLVDDAKRAGAVKVTLLPLRKSEDLASVRKEIAPRPRMLNSRVLQEDRIFRVNLSMKGERLAMTLEGRPVDPAKLADAIKELMRKTGKPEMYLSVADDVHWEDEATVHDAAKVAGVHLIHISGK